MVNFAFVSCLSVARASVRVLDKMAATLTPEQEDVSNLQFEKSTIHTVLRLGSDELREIALATPNAPDNRVSNLNTSGLSNK